MTQTPREAAEAMREAATKVADASERGRFGSECQKYIDGAHESLMVDAAEQALAALKGT